MKVIGDRNSKIKKYQDRKELESKVSELKKEVDKEHVDDEVKVTYIYDQSG